MAANHKLTSVLQGRTIQSTQQQGDLLTVGFDDGSQMTVKTSPSASQAAATGEKVAKVLQQGTTLTLDLESGKSWEVATAEPTSSVMVRDKNHGLEYAD